MLVCCLLLSFVPAHAAKSVASGSCGKNVTRRLDSDGVFTVSGSGPMRGYCTYSDETGASCPFEVDTFDPSGETLVWAKVPSLSADTVLTVYFGAAGVKRTRHAIPAALIADLVGFVASAAAVRLFMK